MSSARRRMPISTPGQCVKGATMQRVTKRVKAAAAAGILWATLLPFAAAFGGEAPPSLNLELRITQQGEIRPPAGSAR